LSGPKVEVIAATCFFGVPSRFSASRDQDQGSDGARLIECAGRVCYQSYGKGRSSQAFAAHLLEVDHGSVLEHYSLSFLISGISRGCSHELVRHRVGTAISQRSTRYVDETTSDWAWHPALRVDEDQRILADLSHFAHEARDLYAMLMERLVKHVGLKQARGAARGILGNALSTELVWTANLRILRHVIAMRASEYADAEIRLLANRLYEAAKPLVPEYLSDGVETPCADGFGYSVRWRRGLEEEESPSGAGNS